MRLFIAIPIPTRIKGTLTALCGGVDGARWQDSESMHLTLRFIGEVGVAMARDIDDALYQITSPCFDLSLCGTGFFSERKLPRSLWAGVENDTALRSLHKKIN